MKTTFLVLCCLFSIGSCFAQSPSQKSYADALSLQNKYSELSKEAWEAKNEKLAELYRDSAQLAYKDAYLEGYTFTDLYKSQISLENLSKPVLLTASASWCAPCMAEIPAYNKIVEEYGDKVTFIILFHDREDKLATFAKKYNKQVFLIPTTQRTEDGVSLYISGFRHTAAYPANYLLTPNRQILALTQGAAAPGKNVTEEQAFQFNYEKLKKEIELILANITQ